MRSTGIIRRVDVLGRIVLPIELRRALNISEKDYIEIFTNDDGIVLKKYESVCIFCGSDSPNYVDYLGKHVCKTCADRLGH